MQHLDPDRLVLLAFSDSTADDDEAVHLTECAGCRAEIDTLKHVADLGAETQDLRDLPPPPEHVWAGIAAEVAKAEPAPAPVTDLAAAREKRRRRPRWLAPTVAAAAAAVLAVAGTVATVRWADRAGAPAVEASATLTPLEGVPPAAAGDAQVLSGGQLSVDVRNLPLTPGHYEIWLIDPDDTTKMQALGAVPLNANEVRLPIPPGTDLNRYRLVDVSAEPNDGNSAHSGNSLLRGTLTS